MLRFLIIERPTTQTLRPHASEASITSCSRWMCDENARHDHAARARRG